MHAVSRVDNYFSSQFDETDAVLVMERTFVPWERVFVMDNAQLSRDIYFKTPAHIMGNHQSMLRFAEKLKLLTGIAHKAAELSGVGHMLPVQQTLGRLMAAEAGLLGMIAGQVEQPETLPNGYCHVNRRFLYAALHWTSNNYCEIAEKVRELLSAGPFQIPADASVFEDAELADIYETQLVARSAPAPRSASSSSRWRGTCSARTSPAATRSTSASTAARRSSTTCTITPGRRGPSAAPSSTRCSPTSSCRSRNPFRRSALSTSAKPDTHALRPAMSGFAEVFSPTYAYARAQRTRGSA